MKMKRIASILLALVMVLSTLVIVPVSAATVLPDAGYKGVAEEDKITADSLTADGKTVMTMDEYEKAVKKDNNVKTFTNTYVSISTPAQWKSLANMVGKKGNWAKSTKNVTFFLTNDLDFDGVTDVTPVGIKYGYFKKPIAEGGENKDTNVGWQVLEFQGHFDGNGYAIKNLNMQTNEYHTGASDAARGTNIFMGLFSSAGAGVTLKNLVIDSTCYFAQNKNDDLGGYMGAAALLGAATGNVVIDNVYNKANVKGGTHAAGIVGRDSNPTITNCTNDGTIQAANTKGGIIGWTKDATVTGCVNNGTILGGGAGGICGRTRGAAKVTDCINNGILVGNGNKVNGIMAAGESGTSTITNCVNTARFNLDWFKNTATDANCVRGIVTKHGGTQNVVGCTSVLEPISQSVYSGYSEWRVGSLVDLSEVPDIKNFETIDANTTLNGEAVSDTNPAIKTFKVTDATGMQKLSDFAKTYNFSGKTIYLANDIDMSTIENFEPIGQYWGAGSAADKAYDASGLTKPKDLAFAGTFDGLGHTISGLNINYSSSERSDAGLFGNMSGTVKNLILDASCSIILSGGNDGHISAGAFAGRGGTVSNCANYASVYAAHNASGLIGREGVCNFSSNYGYIKAAIGAFAFCGFGAASSKQCANYGVINGNQASAVYYTGAATITDAYIAGVISGYSKASGVALVRGKQVNINGCEVAATILSRVNTNADKFYVVDSGTPKVSIDTYSSQKTFTKPVGYSEDLIVDVDLTNVPDITTIYEIVDGTFQLKEGKVATKAMSISNAEGMRLFSAYVNVYDAENASGRGFGTSFYLTNDIDMSGYKFTFSDLTLSAEKSFAPIGWQIAKNDSAFEDAVAFKGYFNGMGHSIKNLTLQGGNEDSGANHLGLFGKITEGTVTNLVIDGSCKLRAGTGVHAQIGGIAANLNNAVVANVWNQANADISYRDVIRYYGGIAAMAHNTGISNATNSGTVSGLRGVGGIVGNATGRVMIVDSRNVANVLSNHTNTAFQSFAGGIVGNTAANSLLVNCENYGAVKTGTIALPGGLFGNVGSNVQYANCYNFGTLTTSVEGGVTADNQISGKGTATANTTIVGVNTTKDTAYETNMLKVWFQTNDKGDVRLVTTIDSLVYDKIVLTITNSEGKTATVDLTGVYTSILAGTVNTEVVDPASYGVDTSLYFATLTLTGAADQTFTVQASAYVGETAVLSGEARTITVA